MATQSVGAPGMSFLLEHLSRFGGIRASLRSQVNPDWHAYVYWPEAIELTGSFSLSSELWNPRARDRTADEVSDCLLALESLQCFLNQDSRRVLMVQSDYFRGEIRDSAGMLSRATGGVIGECVVQYLREDGSEPREFDPEFWIVLGGGAVTVEMVELTMQRGKQWPMVGFIAEMTLDTSFVHGMFLSEDTVVDLVRGVSAIFIQVFHEQLLMLCGPVGDSVPIPER